MAEITKQECVKKNRCECQFCAFVTNEEICKAHREGK